MIASLGTIAASGGYYIAMACDEIVAQSTTITGSIGVVSMRIDFQELYKKALVHVDVVKTEPGADFYDPYRALTEKEIRAFHLRTKDAYETFVSKAAENRNLEFEELEAVARGRVWTGGDALERRLVDHLGGLETAIELARKKIKVPNARIMRFPKEKDFWELIRQGQFVDQTQVTSRVLREMLPKGLRTLMGVVGGSGTGSWQLLAIAPCELEIQ